MCATPLSGFWKAWESCSRSLISATITCLLKKKASAKVSFDSLDELDSSGNHSAAAVTAEMELTAVIRMARAAVLKVLLDLD